MNIAKTSLVLAAFFALGSPAFAQKPPAQTELGGAQSERPWARGVTPQNQKIAIDLFREGNGLLKESLFVQAAEKYREALRHWDHPGIHYNLALALLNLDQPVEVFTHLEEALKYGPAPLDADKYEHAGRYKALIEKQLSRVNVTCPEEGAVVTMDGRNLFTAPGHWEGLVRSGQHTFVAEKSGFVTTQKTPSLASGVRTTVDLPMFTAEELTRYHRRFKQWIPWTVLGGGILIAGIGGVLHWQASVAYNDYDHSIATCSTQNMNLGCKSTGSIASKKSSGDNLQVGAFVMYGVGAAAIVSGAVLAFLNRARPYHVSPEADKVSIAPLFNSNGGGVVATIRF